MSTTHGEVEWNNESGSGGSKVEFLRLSQGKHEIRLLSKPHKYPTHKGIKAEGEKGFGRKVPCSAEYTGEGKNTVYVKGTCPVCDTALVLDNKKLKPSTMYMFWCLDRATKTAKVIDVSWQIFSQIKGLSQDPHWGDPEKFDISVSKNPNSKGPSDFYLVIPIPNTTLDVAEQQVRDAVDLEYLKNRTTPWTLEAVQKILDKVLDGGELAIPVMDEKEEAKAKPQAKTNGGGKKTASAPATELVADTSSDLDEAFPQYDQVATN